MFPISSIGQNQAFDIDKKVGTLVSFADNEKKGIPNVYVYNSAYKMSGKYRYKSIGGQLSSKSHLLAKTFIVEEVIPCKFNYKRIVVLSNENTKLIYDYTVGSPYQLIEANDIPNENLNVRTTDLINENVIPASFKGEFRPNYPDGIYLSKESFKLKTPQKSEIIPVLRKGRSVIQIDSIPQVCDFIYVSSNDIVTNCFAVSYRGFLYFRSGVMVKYKSKNDKAESVREANTFARVIMGGEHFYYTEYEFVNQWSAGLAANAGAVGSAMYNGLYDQKGVVWDFKKEEFDIFKSCKNYNLFLEVHDKSNIKNCKGGSRPNLNDVRSLIKRIK